MRFIIIFKKIWVGGLNFYSPPKLRFGGVEGISDALAEVNVVGRR